jgi:hypothetical protein
MYDFVNLKSAKVILRRGRGKRENNGGDEANCSMLYTYIEVLLKKTTLYNYSVLIKIFF